MFGLTKRELKRLRQHDALLVLENHETGEVRKIWGKNIVTTAGDIFYAQSACGQSTTNKFSRLYLATNGPSTPAKADDRDDFTLHDPNGEKAPSAGYPKTACDDGDNTGAGANVVTWKYEYTTGDGPFVDVGWSLIARTSIQAADPILNSYKWGALWSKDASTSAKIFANHEMEGV